MIPVATAAYRYAVAVATVQFSRAAERALGRPIGTRADRAGHRSLKTQQHARPRTRRNAARRVSAAAARKCETAAGPARSGRRSSCTVGVRRWRPRRRRPRSSARRRAVHAPYGLPRKEVIQPHLPVRLPCYEFTPIIDPTFDGSLPQGVRPPASGVAHSRGVTGGVYKARERIHRGVADPRLLATPPSWRRVSASNPNRDALFGIRSTSRYRSPLYAPM